MKFLNRAARVGMAASAVVAAGAAVAVASPKLPTFSGAPAKGTNPVAKPKAIVYSGDGSAFFAGTGTGGKHPRAGKIHWTSWGSKKGRGTGAQWLNNCTPNCARGKFSAYPVTLVVYRPRKLDHTKVFTRMKVTYTGKRAKGVHTKSQIWKVEFRHGIFDYVFPAGG